MEYSLSEHAKIVIQERGISFSYLEEAFKMPDLIVEERLDEELEHRLKRIPEYKNNCLFRQNNARKGMKLKIDKKTDALYLRLDDEAIVESEETSPGIILDYNKNNKVIGIEVLHLSKRSGKIDLDSLLYKTV